MSTHVWRGALRSRAVQTALAIALGGVLAIGLTAVALVLLALVDTARDLGGPWP